MDNDMNHELDCLKRIRLRANGLDEKIAASYREALRESQTFWSVVHRLEASPSNHSMLEVLRKQYLEAATEDSEE
jgi:hypothetical protein